jgi:hypothetical protein
MTFMQVVGSGEVSLVRFNQVSCFLVAFSVPMFDELSKIFVTEVM